MSTLSIRRVRHLEILSADNVEQLISEYAAECSIPDAQPQTELYRALEDGGALQCFGAYQDEVLIGFVSIVTAIMPHHGKRVATIESLFVLPAHRDSCAGLALLKAAEQHAAETKCVALLYTARVGSRLETILSHRHGCEPSHTVYTRWV